MDLEKLPVNQTNQSQKKSNEKPKTWAFIFSLFKNFYGFSKEDIGQMTMTEINEYYNNVYEVHNFFNGSSEEEKEKKVDLNSTEVNLEIIEDIKKNGFSQGLTQKDLERIK